MHSTGADGCKNRVCYFPSSCGVSPKNRKSKNCGERETELQSEYSRSQDGIEILMEGDAAIFDLA